jgi:hypothetical protein
MTPLRHRIIEDMQVRNIAAYPTRVPRNGVPVRPAFRSVALTAPSITSIAWITALGSTMNASSSTLSRNVPRARLAISLRATIWPRESSQRTTVMRVAKSPASTQRRGASTGSAEQSSTMMISLPIEDQPRY